MVTISLRVRKERPGWPIALVVCTIGLIWGMAPDNHRIGVYWAQTMGSLTGAWMVKMIVLGTLMMIGVFILRAEFKLLYLVLLILSVTAPTLILYGASLYGGRVEAADIRKAVLPVETQDWQADNRDQTQVYALMAVALDPPTLAQDPSMATSRTRMAQARALEQGIRDRFTTFTARGEKAIQAQNRRPAWTRNAIKAFDAQVGVDIRNALAVSDTQFTVLDEVDKAVDFLSQHRRASTVRDGKILFSDAGALSKYRDQMAEIHAAGERVKGVAASIRRHQYVGY